MNPPVTHTINCKGSLVTLDTPKVMGIINITPDSFYDGGVNATALKALETAKEMIQHGATFLDVGGYSSRPNASHITVQEELDRVLPIISVLHSELPEALISIDTFRSQVAEAAVGLGACIVNDISAGNLDPAMIPTVASLKVPYIMMHMRGTPQTMKQHTNYKDVLVEIRQYFSEKIREANMAGINDIIVDPGFGFAKTVAQNFEILEQLGSFKLLEAPILAGLSRKSMIYKTLNSSPQQALNGTTALNMIALQQGATILRVHDVKPAMECIELHLALGKSRL